MTDHQQVLGECNWVYVVSIKHISKEISRREDLLKNKIQNNKSKYFPKVLIFYKHLNFEIVQLPQVLSH